MIPSRTPSAGWSVAITELLLILPGTAFMAALVVRQLASIQDEPGRTAQAFVMWFAGLPVALGLWGLLVALPGAAFAIGVVVLMRARAGGAPPLAGALAPPDTAWTTRVVAAATLTAAGVLAVVGVHVLMN